MAVLSLSTDIKSLIEYYAAIQVVGRPVTVHGILEYHSDCPWCGGKDRFITRPEEGTYSCSIRTSGCGRFGDMITFLREYCNMSFRDACEELGIDPSELGYDIPAKSSAQAYGPPNRTWQERGEQMVAKAQAMLRSAAGKDALAYLRARGFTDDTIFDKRLGYIPLGSDKRWHYTSLEEWGLTAENTGKDKVWQPEGILIPWYVNGRLWKLDVRRLTGLKKDDPKILSITGSVDCLYNHDAVEGGKTAVICESALCAISGEQEAGDLAAFVATGGSGKNKLAWVKHLEQATFTLISLDLDEPDENGKRPGDEGSLYWEKNLSYQVRWYPYKKDINDMLVAGSSIREWVQDGSDWYYTLLVAASEKYVLTPEPVAEKVPDPKPIVENPTSWDELIIEASSCSTCLDLRVDTPAHYEHDDFMYCREHYPPMQSINTLIAKVEQDIPSLRSAKVEYWRTEDSERMKESILRKYQAVEARKEDDFIKQNYTTSDFRCMQAALSGDPFTPDAMRAKRILHQAVLPSSELRHVFFQRLLPEEARPHFVDLLANVSFCQRDVTQYQGESLSLDDYFTRLAKDLKSADESTYRAALADLQEKLQGVVW